MQIAVEPMQSSLDPDFKVGITLDIPDTFYQRLLQLNSNPIEVEAAIVRAFKFNPNDCGGFVAGVLRVFNVLDTIRGDIKDTKTQLKELKATRKGLV